VYGQKRNEFANGFLESNLRVFCDVTLSLYGSCSNSKLISRLSGNSWIVVSSYNFVSFSFCNHSLSGII